MTDTLARILAHTRAELERETLILDVHERIGAVMETYKGKGATKRALVKVREALADLFPPDCVQWIEGPVTIQIAVWGKGTPWPTYDQRQTWDLGYEGAPMTGSDGGGRYVRASNYGGREAFEQNSPATGRGCRERNQARRKLLASQTHARALAKAIDDKIRADAALEKLLEFDEESPYQADRYDFEKMAKSK